MTLGENISTTYCWHCDDWKVLGNSQDPDKYDRVSNVGLINMKGGGIRSQSAQTISQHFLPKSAKFRDIISYITLICHVGINLSHMAGKLLKCRFLGFNCLGCILFCGRREFLLHLIKNQTHELTPLRDTW